MLLFAAWDQVCSQNDGQKNSLYQDLVEDDTQSTMHIRGQTEEIEQWRSREDMLDWAMCNRHIQYSSISPSLWLTSESVDRSSFSLGSSLMYDSLAYSLTQVRHQSWKERCLHTSKSR